MIMFSKITGVFGTGDSNHFLDPISIPTFETSQGQNHVLTGTFKAENVTKLVPILKVYFSNYYLAGRGKWIAFQGGKTTLFTTMSFNQ